MQTNIHLIDPRKFSTDLGSGIFKQDELAKTSYRPTLFLCLGGTGANVGHRLKKNLRQRFGEERMGVFQFLAIDTSPEVVEEGEESFKPGDFVYLRSFNAAELIDHLDENKNIAKWWPGGIENPYRPSFTGDGAGRVRAVGRLVLFNYLSSIIIPKIKEKLSRAQEINSSIGVGNNTLKIYIICSLAGGTGSGMVLDLAYLCRKYAMEYNPTAYVTGVLVLDDPFIQLAKTENECVEFRANTYAALKEINHYSRKNTKFHESYSDTLSTGQLSNNIAPFNIAYLLGLHNANGQVLESLDALTDMIAAEISIEIASPLRDKVISILDNVRSTDFSIAGQPTAFSSFGFSELVFPIKGLSSWCSLAAYKEIAVKLFFKNSIDRQRLEDDVMNFMQANQIDQIQGNQLFEQLDNQNGQPIMLPFVMHDEIKGVHEHIILGMLQRKENGSNEFLHSSKEAVSSNHRRVGDAFRCALDKAIRERLIKAGKGPQVLPSFLRKLRENIINQRDGYLQNEKIITHENAQQNRDDMRLTFENLEKVIRLPVWLPGRDRKIQNLVSRWTTSFNAYLDAVHQENLCDSAILCSNEFERFIDTTLKASDILLNEWRKFADLATEGATSETVQNQAQASEYSLMHSVLDKESMDKLYRDGTPTLKTQEEKTSFVTGFWDYYFAEYPDWRLSDLSHYQRIENPPVQFYYFLGEYYYKKFEPIPLHERMQLMMPEFWEKEIHFRYEQTVPFWYYSLARFGNDIDRNITHEPRLVGYCGGSADDESWKQLITNATGDNVNVINNKNPHSIMFLNTAHGLPLFALPAINNSMKPSYDYLMGRWKKDRKYGNPIPLHVSDIWERQLLELQPIIQSDDDSSADVQAIVKNNGHGEHTSLKNTVEV